MDKLINKQLLCGGLDMNSQSIQKRSGCKDIWNAFMCKKARFGLYDIPYCPTTADNLPNSIITWEEAKLIYRKLVKSNKTDFFVDAFVCWYIDDYKFDSANGIWQNSSRTLKILRHFAGAITPDFSTYQDFPESIKIYNTYRMRTFGYWLGINGIAVINNVRWGTQESFRYCFEGIPTNSIIAIGTCGGSPRKLEDRRRFENGLEQLIKVLKPRIILVYGSANYPCFTKLINAGVQIISYSSQMARAFMRRGNDE